MVSKHETIDIEKVPPIGPLFSCLLDLDYVPVGIAWSSDDRKLILVGVDGPKVEAGRYEEPPGFRLISAADGKIIKDVPNLLIHANVAWYQVLAVQCTNTAILVLTVGSPPTNTFGNLTSMPASGDLYVVGY